MVCKKVRRNLTEHEWRLFVGDALDYEETCLNLPPGPKKIEAEGIIVRSTWENGGRP